MSEPDQHVGEANSLDPDDETLRSRALYLSRLDRPRRAGRRGLL